MKQILVLKTPEVVERACHILKGLDETHEVIIRPYKKDRSASQNSLMWKWLTVIAMELGESKEDVHERCKERFLVPIFERDDTDFAEMIESVRNVWRKGMVKEASALKKQIVSLTSTTKCNVAQFTEYLNEIERDAASLGIILPRPEDVYYEAMGRAA